MSVYNRFSNSIRLLKLFLSASSPETRRCVLVGMLLSAGTRHQPAELVCVSTRPPYKPPIHSLGRTRVRLLPPALPVKLGFGEAQIPPRDTVGAHQSAPTSPPFVFFEGASAFFSNFGGTLRRSSLWITGDLGTLRVNAQDILALRVNAQTLRARFMFCFSA